MKKDKRIAIIVLAVIFSMAAASVLYAASEEKKLKIACIVFQEDMFMQMYTSGVVAAANKYGVDINTSNSSNDAAREAELINTYIEQGYNGICLQTPDEVTAFASVKRGVAAGLQFVVATILTEEMAPYVVTAILTSGESLGQKSGEAAVRYVKEKGIQEVNIGIVQFKSQAAYYSNQRSSSFLKAFDDAGVKYTLVSDQDAWLQDTAITTATDMLTANPQINILYGANDGATIGTTMAVKNINLTDQVAVFGTDASEQICQLLLDDQYSLIATAAQDAYGSGFEGGEVLIKSLRGEDVSEYKGKTILGEALPLNDFDKAAVEAYIETLKTFQ
jgi:simple sugar transport system substrate-binding protein